MSFSFILVFYIVLVITWVIYHFIGGGYALDHPDYRKQHKNPTPQIGGIIFGPFFLLTVWLMNVAPGWYLICGLISIFLGAVDDINHISWKIKLFVQIILAFYIANIFWTKFELIYFYDFSINLPNYVLLGIFLVWFVGIYNAVNLLDGLDGLAGGFSFIISLGLFIFTEGKFSHINGIFSIIILAFLVYNQRPAKLFMGDAGSLFLGFHIASLPLVYVESNPSSGFLLITPFVLLASYLVADTTRVFFTRLADKKSPMTADTIHFHHLIYNKSGSYLAATGLIYFITLISVITAILSFESTLSSNIMIAHFALLLVFILTPPIQTYVPVITKIVKPFYRWQKIKEASHPSLVRTSFMILLLFSLILSIIIQSNFSPTFNLSNILSLLFFFILLILTWKDTMTIYVLQITIISIITKLTWQIELDVFSKLLVVMLCVSYSIFFLEKRIGCSLSKFSSIDLLIIITVIGGISFYLLGFPIYIWTLYMIFGVWFSVRFILLRTYLF